MSEQKPLTWKTVKEKMGERPDDMPIYHFKIVDLEGTSEVKALLDQKTPTLKKWLEWAKQFYK